MATYDTIVDVKNINLTATFQFVDRSNGQLKTLSGPIQRIAPDSVKATYLSQVVIGPRTLFETPRDGKSFKKIVRDGTIKMTELHKETVTSTNFIIQFDRHDSSWEFWHAVDSKGCYAQKGFILHKSSYVEQYDLERFMRAFPTTPTYLDLPYQEEIDRAKNSVKSAVISDAQSSFDLLTTAAEGKEAIELILNAIKAARHPIKTFLRVRAGLKNPRDYASAWLQFRYGIMPLIYTIKDAVELYDTARDRYLTSRAKEKVDKTLSTYKGDFPHIFKTTVVTAEVRGVSKARFDSSVLRLSDQINVNPFLTGWELITLSFVIDWFLNVGDVISAKTMSFMDFSSQRVNSCSVKSVITETIFYQRPAGIAHENQRTISCSFGDHVSPRHVEYRRNVGSLKLRETVTESYDRRLFQPGDVELALNPQMNWKRWADALALSLNPILNELRKLRR